MMRVCASLHYLGKLDFLRRFLCPHCRNEVHFSNRQCVKCLSFLGYVPSRDAIVLLGVGDDGFAAKTPDHTLCGNRNQIGCNWICESDESNSLCLSCVHTTKIPNTQNDVHRMRWDRLERAKRRLFYAIIKFQLPLANHADGTRGFLHFELLSDQLGKVDKNGKPVRVMTGHSFGKITININEADDVIREKHRVAMGEPYRTLIGHFRHEVAHYYWDKLVANKPAITGFRQCFGDERADYSKALKAHYKSGPKANWQQSFVSAYAASHPWEDFAETWAHYFHMVSGLETAYAYQIDPQPIREGASPLPELADPYDVNDLERLLKHWIPLTVAMNAMNRSIGNSDYYPFVLSDAIRDKLKFIHTLIKQGDHPMPEILV